MVFNALLSVTHEIQKHFLHPICLDIGIGLKRIVLLNGTEYFLGSVRQLVDAGGALTLAQSYTPYGEVLATEGEAMTSYAFTGEALDAYTGLIYLRARWYGPLIGRFIQKDPFHGIDLGPQSFNAYLYALDNPVRYLDPSGECPPCWLLILLGITTISGCSPGPAPVSGPNPALVNSAVEITDLAGNHTSSGTQINSDTVLTHNHFGSPLNSYVAVDSSTANQPFLGAASDPVGQDIVIAPPGINTGKQTRLVTFPNPLGGNPARIASQRIINSLGLKDVVDIVYWDDSSSQFAIGQFVLSDISNLANGAISVADPNNVLNHGDSGGGVYYNGELIGNLWSIVGGAHIALVPSVVNGNSKASTIVR